MLGRCLALNLFVLVCVVAPARAEVPPNVILVLADDMGFDIAALGHPHVKTPNLDRLVSEGRVFEHFYVASPACSPSRVSFIAGTQPSRTRIHDYLSADSRLNSRRGMPNYLDPNLVLITDVARRAGYRTGHYGKWHVSRGPGAPSLTDYGLDSFRTSWPFDARFKSFSSLDFVDAAIEFIEESGDQPFYLDLSFFQMHSPVVAATSQRAVYEGETFPINDFESSMQDYSASMPDAHERFLTYNAVITTLDEAVGRLLDHLDQTGLSENTMLLFTSDNGPEDYRIDNPNAPGAGNTGPFRGRKRSLYEGGIRMPCIARWPGVIPAGTVDTTSVLSSIDWFPTVSALIGGESPPFLDGENRLEVFKGTPSSRTNPLIWEYRSRTIGDSYDAPQFAIREGRWKLFWEAGIVTPELYDIVADPGEQTNLSASQADVVAALQQKIITFRDELTPQVPEASVEPPPVPNVLAGGTISLRCEAIGSPPPAYQWFRDGIALHDGPDLAGSASHFLELSNLKLADSGEYVCRARNSTGTSTSNPTQIAVDLVPKINNQPTRMLLWEGGIASFSVTVRGSEPLSYVWYRNDRFQTIVLSDGNGIVGSQTPNLQISGLQAPFTLSNEDGYRCLVSNPLGQEVSDGAGIQVIEPQTPSFAEWTQFYSEGLGDPEAYGADDDVDGSTNFQEYAAVKNPNDAGDYPLLEIRKTASGLEIAYDRWRGGSETGFGGYETNLLRYELETLDGESWQPNQEPLDLIQSTPFLGLMGERVAYRFVSPIPKEAMLIRLKISEL